MKFIISLILIFASSITNAQNSGIAENPTLQDSITYEAKMIKTSRMNMEYMDFGGEGKVLIHIQGVHNSAYLKDNPFYHGSYELWKKLLGTASQYYRVYSPIYRGYGNSDTKGTDIYHIENIAKDILAYMDAMGIESAVLIGRTTAPQVMFYIAEHYPNRVEAMVVRDSGSLYKWIPLKNKEVEEYIYFSSYRATDLEDKAPQVQMPTFEYEPRFYQDKSAKIDIPLFWPYSEENNILFMFAGSLERLKPDNKFYTYREAKEYFDKLYLDEQRTQRLKTYFEENDITKEVLSALKIAFGERLTLCNFDDFEGENFNERFDKGYTVMLDYLISVSGKND